MNKISRALRPLAVITAAILIAWVITHNRPTIERKPPPRTALMTVETVLLQPRSYNVTINSYGTVQPRTRVELKSQLNGQVIRVSENFRAGGYFEKDDVLVQIDPRDFEAQVKIAEAALANARQALSEEQARSNQAHEDWQRLNMQEEPSALVLRQPQLLAAQAGVASAEASLSQAKLNLARTTIRAPYAGRIIAIQADVGQVVSNGGSLADIFSIDALEVRLPLRNQDLAFISLPESYRYRAAETSSQPKVVLESALPGSEQWSGRVVRTEGTIDEPSQQLHVIARIDDPYGNKAEGHQPLKIGQYVKARIEGKQLSDALVIPNHTIYQGSYVYIVADGLLKRRDVVVAWHNNDDAIIGAGLQAGDRLVTTALGQVPSGTPVSVAGPNDRPRRSAQTTDTGNRP